jgi:uncharacterized membrane protein
MLRALQFDADRAAKEVSMDEVFPVLGGIALGLASYTVRPLWLRAVVVVILGAGIGAMAASISGELADSQLYLLVDAVQVIVAGVLTGGLVELWLRRCARALAR